MAQEFTINSSAIETKINQLLPSQGGFGAGVDFSASTMVIPIVDLTESASGSQLRQDLQSSLSLNSITSFSVTNASSTLINTTGYFRVFGDYATTGGDLGDFRLTDGTTTKTIISFVYVPSSSQDSITLYDFNVFLEAGQSLICRTTSSNGICTGNTRQIASLDGTLTNP
tara:strand:- start:1659 stop:2168 length:510 start_codon:yes stop_codon:yes gene_type:complete